MCVPELPQNLQTPVAEKKFKGLHWVECPKLVNLLLDTNDTFITDQAFFKKGSSISSFQLTYGGCVAICGPQRHWYDDSGQILLQWLIPILTFAACIKFGNKKALPHLFGNPHDFFHRNLIMLEGASRASRRAEEEAGRLPWNEEAVPNTSCPTIAVPIVSLRIAGNNVAESADIHGRDSFQTAETTLTSTEPSDVKISSKISSQEPIEERNDSVLTAALEERPKDISATSGVNTKTQGPQQNTSEIAPHDLNLAKASVYTYLEAVRRKEGCQHDFLREIFRTSSPHPGILSDIDQKRFIVDVAQALSRGRTHDLGPVIVALTLYILTSAASFSVVLGGNPTTVPGGRISVAMTFHYLISAVLITCLIGSFPSRAYSVEQFGRIGRYHGLDFAQARKIIRVKDHQQRRSGIDRCCLNTIHGRDPKRDVELGSYDPGEKKTSDSRNEAADSSLDLKSPIKPTGCHPLYSCFNCRSRTGPCRSLNKDHTNSTLDSIPRQAYLYFAAFIPILVSSGFALSVLWRLPPIGATQRFLFLIGLNFWYMLSAGITLIVRTMAGPGRIRSLVIWIKDCIFAITSLSLSIMSTAGLFNTCRGWAPFFNPFVVLDQKGFEHNSEHLYPLLFGVELALQVGMVLLLYFVFYKAGFAVLRWSSASNDRLYDATHSRCSPSLRVASLERE